MMVPGDLVIKAIADTLRLSIVNAFMAPSKVLSHDLRAPRSKLLLPLRHARDKFYQAPSFLCVQH